jgi:hypothetical protein
VQIKHILGLITALAAKFDSSNVDTNVSLGTDNSKVPSQGAVKSYVDSKLSAYVGGLVYKGTFDASVGGAVFPPDVAKGWFYKVSGAGTILGKEMAVGDMIIANTNKVGATAAADWDKIDNTEAADIVRTGLTSAAALAFATSNSALVAGDDAKLPTVAAVRTALGNYEPKFTEVQEVKNVAGSTAANTPIALTLAAATAASFVLDIKIDGCPVLPSQITHTIGTTAVSLNVPYAVEPAEAIVINYVKLG